MNVKSTLTLAAIFDGFKLCKFSKLRHKRLAFYEIAKNPWAICCGSNHILEKDDGSNQAKINLKLVLL